MLPGSELEVRPLDRKAPVVVRIVQAYPHGSAFRYDLVFYGLDPGEYDLKAYLRRKDRTSVADLPAIPVRIERVLPPGQILPHALEPSGSPFLGGYRVVLVVLGGVWVVGLAALLFVGRRKRVALAPREKHDTLADRLRPLVEGAMVGTLSPVERADLERMLLGYWKTRLNLGKLKPDAAFAVLRKHAEAGPLLEQLEIWLHRPGPAPTVDLPALLRPYREGCESSPERGR